MIAPMKDAVLFTEVRWSKWIESVRKDVECTFGILKGRFRILKIGIRIHSIESVDQLWCTCCALHNMFLFADGLSETWAEGGESDWEGELGLHNENDISNIHFDLSGMGVGNDRSYFENDPEKDSDEESTFQDNDVNNEFQFVRAIHHNTFRQKLINHFDILFTQHKIKWPTRTGQVVPDI